MSKIQTFIKNYSDNLILVYQFLSLKWTKKSKTNLNYGTPPPNYNYRVKITNINSNCNSFTNLIKS